MVEDTAVLDVLHVAPKQRQHAGPHCVGSIRKVPDEDSKPALICFPSAAEVGQAGQK